MVKQWQLLVIRPWRDLDSCFGGRDSTDHADAVVYVAVGELRLGD